MLQRTDVSYEEHTGRPWPTTTEMVLEQFGTPERQTRDHWALLTVGAIAALKDPAEYYRRAGEAPERAAVLGARIGLAMRNSKRGAHEDELHDPTAITSTQCVPGTEFSTLITLAMLTVEGVEAAETLEGATNAERFPVQCLTEETGDATADACRDCRRTRPCTPGHR